MPYFPYSRQDKLGSTRTSLASKLLTKMLKISGADRIVTLNAHSEDICRFSHLPVINMKCDLFLMERFMNVNRSRKYVLVAPDAGSEKSCLKIMSSCDILGAMIHKGKTLKCKFNTKCGYRACSQK